MTDMWVAIVSGAGFAIVELTVWRGLAFFYYY